MPYPQQHVEPVELLLAHRQHRPPNPLLGSEKAPGYHTKGASFHPAIYWVADPIRVRIAMLRARRRVVKGSARGGLEAFSFRRCGCVWDFLVRQLRFLKTRNHLPENDGGIGWSIVAV
jgi:hypothetical protein